VSLDLRQDGGDVHRLAGIDIDAGRVEVQSSGLGGCPPGDHLVGLMLREVATVSAWWRGATSRGPSAGFA
jgi:hypothetical protein